MIKRSRLFIASIGAAALALSSAGFAGEIKGPPPGGNIVSDPGTRISNGASVCSFSGLNDTPDGVPGLDPGGIVQSYGYFFAQFGIFDPSSPDKFNSDSFPGENCNPNRGPRLPH